MSSKELKQVLKLATARRTTILKRLELARARQDDVKCDELYSRLAYENELIHNCSKSLEAAE